MSVSIPFSFVGGPGNKARASEVNANFSAVAAKFTEGAGGISDSDVSSTAGIKGSKLSSVAGTRITQAQMDDNAVDGRILKDDPSAGHAAAAVNLADHIADGIITPAKIAAGSIAKDRLKVTEVTQAFSFNFLVGGAVAQTTSNNAITPAPALPLMSAMLPIRCTVESYSVSGPAGAGGEGATVGVYNSGGATLYALVYSFRSSGGGTFTISGTIRFTYLALT